MNDLSAGRRGGAIRQLEPPVSYRNALRAAVAAAREAGALIRAEFERPGGPRGFGGHAPVDTEAELLIRDRLLRSEEWRYLGEETGPGGEDRDDEHCWIVDPHDGTRSFLRGLRGTAVSIAALRRGQPVLGVVYAPTVGRHGDLIAWAEGCGRIRRNGRPAEVSLRRRRLGRDAVVLVSQDAGCAPDSNSRCVSPARYEPCVSIAYRLARVAAGDAIAAVSLAGACAWDFAAGHALVRGAGGELVDEEGRPVRYGVWGESRTAFCFGGARAAVRELATRPWGDVFDEKRAFDPSTSEAVL